MRSANDLFEWIVTSSQLNDVLVICAVICGSPLSFIASVDSFDNDTSTVTVAKCCITLAHFVRLLSAVNEPEVKSVRETPYSSCGRRNAAGVHTKSKAVDVLYIGGT